MRQVLALVLLTFATATQAAAGFQDIPALEGRLLGLLNADIGWPGGPVAPIDRRLKLAACPERVAIDPPALGAVAIRCAALGWRIRVPLVRQVGPVAAAAASPLVKRGDPVSVVAQSRSFSVSGEGVAQDDGAAGARIRVRTDKGAAPIIAEVVDVGLVRVASAR